MWSRRSAKTGRAIHSRSWKRTAISTRRAVDDKAEGAMWVDTLVRFREEKYRPLRTLKLALTCGEETSGALNGAQWLTQNRRDLIDAAFAINEGARGEFDAEGHRVALEVQAGEKTSRTTASRSPIPEAQLAAREDNAIYRLAGALKKIEAYTFAPQFTDGNRAYFAGMAKIQAAKGEAAIANALQALVRDPADAQAIALVSAKDPGWNATLRTTCVATMLDAGHATNALPQRARANINCRIFPGVTQETVRAQLEELVADPAVKVRHSRRAAEFPAPATDARNPGAAGEARGPVLARCAGAADSAAGRDRWTVPERGGIPTYGIEPLFLGRISATSMASTSTSA